MAAIAPSIYAAIVTCLGFACFALSATAVGLPVWGRFRNLAGATKNNFFNIKSPLINSLFFCFQVTKTRATLGRGKYAGSCRIAIAKNAVPRCPTSDHHVSVSFARKTWELFDLMHTDLADAIYVAGLLATFACIAFGLYCVLCILQIAMISSREKVVMRYTTLVVLKLLLALVGSVLALIAVIMFGVTADNSRGQFSVTRGASFYVQLTVVVLAICLAMLAVYDLILARKPDGDPTMLPTVSDRSGRSPPTTVVNPGYRDTPRGRGGRVGEFCGILIAAFQIMTKILLRYFSDGLVGSTVHR